MRGLALEGGGAKGAYQAGAIKAFNKKKIYFDGAAGTSIGSINAAFYSSKNFDGLYKLWLSMDSKYLFGIDNNFENKSLNLEEIKKGLDSILKIIKNNGIDTTNIMKVLSKNIKENKLRNSGIGFGLVTYNLTDKKPVEISIEDIPNGKLIEYIMASSYLPVFKFKRIIDDKYYIDGGVYLNCPIEMFINKGYKEIYVVRAWENKKLKYDRSTKTKIHVITPSENLGSIMTFSPDISEYRMNLGYYDTLKYLDKLDGKKYYFKRYNEKYYNNLFDKSTLQKMIKKYSSVLIVKNNKKFIISILEKICDELGIKRFKIHNMPYLITALKYKMVKHKDSIYYDFIKNIKVNFE